MHIYIYRGFHVGIYGEVIDAATLVWYRFVHESYPCERWRGHSTIFLHVSTRRDDLEGFRVEGFGDFLDFLGRLGLISKIVGSYLVSKSESG